MCSGDRGHNIEGTMQTVEWIQSGAIGAVRKVHMWSNRPVWAQGYLDRPQGIDVPSNLNYDLWLGPALEYDAENMKITNCDGANEYFHYEYRHGWGLLKILFQGEK